MGSTSLAHTAPASSVAGGSYRQGRLRYANAQDLPSFPSTGLKKDSAAASAAASLGWANSKSPEAWKPDPLSSSASAAALLASDGRATSASVSPPAPTASASASASTTPWEPQYSSAGSQAAILAASSAKRHQQQKSLPPSMWGNSAANLAFKASKTPPPPATETLGLARHGSMHAAKGAMAGLRPRSISSPQNPRELYPDQANAASNALSAATIAHRPSTRASAPAPLGDAGAIPYTTMNRLMFTSHPPVKPETDEQNRADVIHASALAMAKRMFTQQQKMIDTARAHASAQVFGGPSSPHGEEQIPTSYGTLQEAAYRLAQERLAKLEEEHQNNRGYQEYYSSSGVPQRSAFGSIRGKLTRRRSASDGDLVEDQRRSQHIRKQMSLFNTKLTEVDEQKRTRDREALLAAAQRNVKAQMKDMDDKLSANAPRTAPVNMGDWEVKAHTAAQARFDATRNENEGKIDLGGGKFINQNEVDEIAAKRIQPILDEINEKAERERERRALLKLEEDKQKEETERNKIREREVQEIHKKLKEQQKDDEKARLAEIKQEEKRRKEEEKAAKAEQKQIVKDGKQKENEVLVVPIAVATAATTTGEETEQAKAEAVLKPSPTSDVPGIGEKTATTGGGRSHALSISFHKRQKQKSGREASASTEKPPASDGEQQPPTSPTSKVKSWLRNRLPRPRAKSSGAATDAPLADQDPTAKDNGGGFIGGAKLRKTSGSNPSVDDNNNTRHSRSESVSTSMREVAVAGRGEDEVGESATATATAAAARARTPSPLGGDGNGDGDSRKGVPNGSVSSMGSSSDSSMDRFEEARSEQSRPVTPPLRAIKAAVAASVSSGGRSSPFRESRFSENLA
ncbi:hypothetical protein B0T26DRAFT_764961 [Lasiosphaeria miniovina]|uniref:Eisosome protein 1 n=1 Tax=Lasiosphaeria miniovina TaxID=1954250 RepID=A0AA40B440_9PEZI|nr:uncharacterized protein B0T26DRAFT_764961 [Lasiosphaeria miniovina]KAK0727245.1 hypothetical protein B0T26DRAFT_764961 [Lasiosphaeria miniovina]